jgi:DNA-binding NarL/FixJ family response regulator
LRVLKGVAAGATYRAIATELYLSPATIAYHADRLKKRFGVANNAALVAIALVTGLLTVDAWPPELTGLSEVDAPALTP